MTTRERAAGDLLAAPAAFSDAARRYSTLGWALARADGKRPLGKGWQTAAPVDPDYAAGQWAHWGEQWNLGVVLGPSQLVVVEFDTDAAGETLANLLDHQLPLTPVVQSGSGRLHLYFHDTGIAHATRDGLELRAGAHFMVLPPSVHPNGHRVQVAARARAARSSTYRPRCSHTSPNRRAATVRPRPATV